MRSTQRTQTILYAKHTHLLSYLLLHSASYMSVWEYGKYGGFSPTNIFHLRERTQIIVKTSIHYHFYLHPFLILYSYYSSIYPPSSVPARPFLLVYPASTHHVCLSLPVCLFVVSILLSHSLFPGLHIPSALSQWKMDGNKIKVRLTSYS